jgi:guanylate kinase
VSDFHLPRRTFPVVLSAPSGAGKTTLARRLRELRDDVVFSVSATTRPPRAGEVDGRDYHFVPGDEFRRMIAQGELIEWAQVHGNFYGTPRRNVREAREAGKFLLLDIDVQGAAQIRVQEPEAVHVFILPPSGQELLSRLTRRGSESDEVRLRRLANARDEVRDAPQFDYVVVNDDVRRTVAELDAIIRAESLKASRIPALEAEVARLCGEIDGYLGSVADPSNDTMEVDA